MNFFKLFKNFWHVIINYLNDILRYFRYSTTLHRAKNEKELEARIIAHYHIIEKGLSMPKIKLGFGKKIILSLIKLLIRYINSGYDQNKTSFLAALESLQQYAKYHKKHNFDIAEIESKINSLPENNNQLGGYKETNKKVFLKNLQDDFKLFSQSRYSVRNYSSKEVDVETIKEAIKIAQKSPSVCNRQSARVYIIKNTNIIKKILKLQTGNRGFGHLANKLLIITTDLSVFEGIRERNQCYIDGGIFTMSLLYALHYQGLGVCTLNWCNVYKQDKLLRKQVHIKNSENVIAILTLGHLPDEFKLAKSNRKKIEEIIYTR